MKLEVQPLNLSFSQDDRTRLAQTRVAYLFPSLKLGNYWHPILSRFTHIVPQTRVYTGSWDGFSRGYEQQFQLTIVGSAKFFPTESSLAGGYIKNVGYLSPKILGHLFRLRPHVIFVSAFSVWTLLSVLVKPLLRWRVVILYDGWSPTYDYQNSSMRLRVRRWIAQSSDRVITNSHNGATYLTDALRVAPDRIQRIPYQVPDVQALNVQSKSVTCSESTLAITNHAPQTLRLITIGQMITRKGIDRLLQALHLLQGRGRINLHLTCVGSGDALLDLQALSRSLQLEKMVEWVGHVPYDRIGEYLTQTDVFVFPTLEDVWGMAPLEAMVWGKPIICSQYSGCAESMIIEGKTGFQVDPNHPETIANAIEKFLDRPDWIDLMGEQAKAHISKFSPDTAAHALLALTLELG